MPVRDLEWFGAPRPGSTCSRTAAPTASTASCRPRSASRSARRSPTALLIGDVAFLHDTNGLLDAATRGVDLTIVVVDNDGGGIFSFLPQATELGAERFERLFGTPHGVDVAALAGRRTASPRSPLPVTDPA